MTATDARTETDARPGAGSTPTLRPGRMETDRLAQRIAVAPGREERDVTSPLTGEVIGRVPIGTAEDVTAAVAEARRVQKRWAATSVKERAAVLLRYHDLVLDRQEELLDLYRQALGMLE